MMIDKKTEVGKVIYEILPFFRKAALVTIIAGLLSLAPVGYMREVYGPIVNSGSQLTLLYVTILLIWVLGFNYLLELVRDKYFLAASQVFAKQLSERVFTAVFRAQLQEDRRARQALGDLRVVKNFLASGVPGYVLEIPVGIIFLFIIFLMNPVMGYFSIFGALLTTLVTYITEKKVSPLIEEAQAKSNTARGTFVEMIANREVIMAMGMIGGLSQRFRKIQTDYVSNQALASDSQSLGSSISKFINLSQGSLLLAVGIYLTIIGVIHPSFAGGLIIAKIIGGKALQPMMQLVSSMKNIFLAKDSYVRLKEFLSDTADKKPVMALPRPSGRLDVNNLGARIPTTKKTVLWDVSFSIPAGKKLVVLGNSATGKTSLVKLLVGLWPANMSGSVRLDGADVYTWDKDELGAYIGYMPQEVRILDGSIAENICRFGDCDESLLNKAIKLAGLAEWIESLPDGIYTEVGASGGFLSGGQRQLLAFARAIYGAPSFVVLDEPNANLDDASEARMMAAINNMSSEGTTFVIVSHRRNVIDVVDYVLYMGYGRPIAFGAKDKVIEEMKKMGLPL